MIWLPIVGSYVEIDAYASILAYTDLLNQRSKPAKSYIPHTPNYSVPDELRIRELENSDFTLEPDDEAIILDVSVPEPINKLVPTSQILELIDHHPGYEEYWHAKIGNKAIIEKIGAVATSIFEWWGECWDYSKMSPQIARLLLAAILDNTLNFNAKITTDRDRAAAKKLAKIAQTTIEKFSEWYFTTVSSTITANLEKSILGDCKMVNFPPSNREIAFGQLTLWNTQNILSNSEKITQIMNSRSADWTISILDISKRNNYLLTSSEDIADYFSKLLNVDRESQYLKTNQLYLRKEIIAKMLA